MSADLPTKPDQIRPESRPLIEASNGHTRPSDLSVFLPLLSPAVTLAHTFFVFFCHVYPPPSPHRLVSLPISLRGTVISLFLRWIGFSAAVTGMEAAPPSPGFCHLSKTRCHFHSPSRPPQPPRLLSPCFLASISYGAELCVCERVCRRLMCNPDSLQPKSILFEIWSIMETFLPTPTFHFHISSSLLPPLFSLYDTFPFRSPLSNQENMMLERAGNTFSDIITVTLCLKREVFALYFGADVCGCCWKGHGCHMKVMSYRHKQADEHTRSHTHAHIWTHI